MSFAVKDGVPGMRFETHDSASMQRVLAGADTTGWLRSLIVDRRVIGYRSATGASTDIPRFPAIFEA
jgi:hypothetical protein